MKELVGKTVNAVRLNGQSNLIVFDTDQGQIVYTAEGDCCSLSYFAEIMGIERLLGQTVIAAEDRDLTERDSDDGEQKYYGIMLTTVKGYIDIVYRNDSNGFYGGWVQLFRGTPNLGRLYDVREDVTSEELSTG